MNSDLSLGDLKKQKKKKSFIKKSALKYNSIFFIVNFPMRPELVFFIACSLLKTQNWSIFGVNFCFEMLFFHRKYFNLKKKITLKVNKYPVFTPNFNPR